jgi:two-component system response regulator AtoC
VDPRKSLIFSRFQILVRAGEASRVYPLPESGTVSIGRERQNHICIDDPAISRQHASLQLFQDRVEIRDLASSGGTFLQRGPAASGGERGGAGAERLVAHARVPLNPGDTLSIGSALLSLQSTAWAATAPPAPPAPLEAGTNVLRAPGLWKAYELATRAAATELSVLILGETGVGKDVLAEVVHRHSPRAGGPLTILNCASLSEGLLESELFGHERGAFTGAHALKRGLLEASQGGTIFLDEIGELPTGTQAKLLRMLEERTVMRVGATASHAIDIRFVSATNRDLRRRVREGRFRSDLYYRISGVVVHIPPLRERLIEVEPLARLFIAKLCESLRQPEPVLSPAAVEVLRGHPWPGNVRELKNVMERAVLLADGAAIGPAHIQLDPPVDTSQGRSNEGTHGVTPENAERSRIVAALEKCGGNQTRAAKLLGISRTTLVQRLDIFQLPRPKKS